MRSLVDYAEGLLQGRYHGGDLLRRERPPVGAGTLLAIALAAGGLYGACMGLYGWRWGTDYGPLHVAAVVVKVPLLFLLTLVVCGPSLHVFATLAGSRLAFGQTLRLLLAATALALVVLASFGPVTAFFTFSTRSHPFLQLLNAALFTVSGLAGMRFVWRRLGEVLADADEELEAAAQRSAARRPAVARVFLTWFVIYASVAAQMGWLLRPFVGTPHLPQELFRRTEGNIFAGLVEALRYLD